MSKTKELFDKLYSNNPLEIQSGINAVLALKSSKRVAVAIESTCDLLSATLKDNFETSSLFDIYAVRLLYSFAIIRFVNGIIDKYQNKQYAASVHSIAEKIGLPSYFVELRHQSTHDELSSLEILRSAANHALLWLRENYWEKHAENPDSSLSKLLSIYSKSQSPSMLTEITSNSSNYSKLLNLLPLPHFLGCQSTNTVLKDSVSEESQLKTYEMWKRVIDHFCSEWDGFGVDLLLAISNVLIRPPESLEVEDVEEYLDTLADWCVYLLVEIMVSDTMDSKVVEVIELCLRNENSQTKIVLDEIITSDNITALGVSFLLDDITAEEKISRLSQLKPLMKVENHTMQSVNAGIDENIATEFKWNLSKRDWVEIPVGTIIGDSDLRLFEIPMEWEHSEQRLIELGIIQMPN